MPFLEIDDVRVHFKAAQRRSIRAVDGVSFRLGRGQTLGLVGESGCGKTTLGNAIIGLVPLTSGAIRVDGRDVGEHHGADLLAFRRQVQMIFQDPFGSLNPRMTVGASIGEVLKVHGLARGRRERGDRVEDLLEAVGLERGYANRYPHEFSGGQRQRVGTARALALDPAVIIADEPVSALDVSVQVQILNLLRRLQAERNLAYVLIAHDLAVVRYMCDRVLVMYLGKIVEAADAGDLFDRYAHPYTEALLSAVPDVDRGLSGRRGDVDRIVLRGDVPSAADTIPGCPFHTRCHRAQDVCRRAVPSARDVGRGHVSACHFAEEVLSSTGES